PLSVKTNRRRAVGLRKVLSHQTRIQNKKTISLEATGIQKELLLLLSKRGFSRRYGNSNLGSKGWKRLTSWRGSHRRLNYFLCSGPSTGPGCRFQVFSSVAAVILRVLEASKEGSSKLAAWKGGHLCSACVGRIYLHSESLGTCCPGWERTWLT